MCPTIVPGHKNVLNRNSGAKRQRVSLYEAFSFVHEAKSRQEPSERHILPSYGSELGHMHTHAAVGFEKASIRQREIGAFIISLGLQQLMDNREYSTHHSLTYIP